MNANLLQENQAILTELLHKYPAKYFRFYAQEDYRLDRTTLVVEIDVGHSRIYEAKKGIDTGKIVRVAHIAEFVIDEFTYLTNSAIVALGEEVTGKYPFTRLYHDMVLNNGLPSLEGELFLRPSEKVPGWVHNRFRNQHDYPKEGVVVQYQDKELKPELVASQSISYPDSLGEIDMADTKKKKVVIQKRRNIDPSRIKKPKCAIHQTDMNFNPVDGKWHCDTNGCSQIARPKRAEDDKSVTIGKGGLSLRLVVKGQEAVLLLISDDNVALNVTPLVDIKEIVEQYDLLTYANVASDSGRDSFVIEIEKSVLLKGLRLGVLGVEDLILFPQVVR